MRSRETVYAKVITRCGCVKKIALPELLPVYRVGMLRRTAWTDVARTDSLVYTVRRFELEDSWMSRRGKRKAIYREAE